MFSIKPIPLFNMGNLFILLIFGVGLGILSFIVVVIVEASVMKQFFNFPLRQRMKYSLIVNLVTATAGYFYVEYIAFRYEGFFKLGFIAIILTIIIEYICLLLLIRKKSLLKGLLGYSLVSNLASYGFLICILILAAMTFWT